MFLHRLLPGPGTARDSTVWRAILFAAELWLIVWVALTIATFALALIGPTCYVDWQPVACSR